MAAARRRVRERGRPPAMRRESLVRRHNPEHRAVAVLAAGFCGAEDIALRVDDDPGLGERAVGLALEAVKRLEYPARTRMREPEYGAVAVRADRRDPR